MKKFKKIIALALCAIMVCSILAGCKKNEEEPSAETDGTSATDNEETPSSGIAVSDLGKYSVVYPEDASDELIDAVGLLVDDINSSFKVNISAKTDYVNEVSQSYKMGDYEIIVGETNRDESKALNDSLKYKDYGYALTGSKIAISGLMESTVIKAIEKFTLDIILSSSPDAELFMTAEQNKTVSGDYDHKTITLGGTDISEYRIVYKADGNAFEKQLADKLWLAIAEDCGAMLDVVSDATAYADGYEILIGKTNRSANVSTTDSLANGEGYFAQDGKFAVACGNSALGNATAVNAFIDAFEEAEKTDSLAITAKNGKVEVWDNAKTLSVMSFNVWVGNYEIPEGMEAVTDTIIAYLPDVVGLQEVHSKKVYGTAWIDYITKGELNDYYGVLGYDVTDEKLGDHSSTFIGNPLLYAKDKFNVLESGTKWLTETPDTPSKVAGASEDRHYSYAVLERIADGVKFLVINTHFDTEGASIRVEEAMALVSFLDGYSDMAKILLGDFNAVYQTNEIKILVDSGLTVASDMATTVDKGGKQNLNGMIDHIFFTDNYVDANLFEVITWNPKDVNPSDHDAIYSEFTIAPDGDSAVVEKTPIIIEGTGIGRDEHGNDFETPDWIS